MPGRDDIFSYGGVTPEKVMPLVHGCIFTRGPKDLHRTAIFVGGRDVAAGERCWPRCEAHAAAVRPERVGDARLQRREHHRGRRRPRRRPAPGPASTPALVLGGTGPVGQRVARLLARARRAQVRVGSRQKDAAEAACEAIRDRRCRAPTLRRSRPRPRRMPQQALDGRELVVAAGAAGAVLLPKKVRTAART